MAWQREKSEPSAPPSSTISYRSLMGFEKLFLYAFKPCRIWDRMVLSD